MDSYPGARVGSAHAGTNVHHDEHTGREGEYTVALSISRSRNRKELTHLEICLVCRHGSVK